MNTGSGATSAPSLAGTQAMCNATFRPSGAAGFSATDNAPHCASTLIWPNCGASVHGRNGMLPSMRGGAGVALAATAGVEAGASAACGCACW